MKKLLIKIAVAILKRFADKWDIDLNKNQKNDILELIERLEQVI